MSVRSPPRRDDLVGPPATINWGTASSYRDHRQFVPFSDAHLQPAALRRRCHQHAGRRHRRRPGWPGRELHQRHRVPVASFSLSQSRRPYRGAMPTVHSLTETGNSLTLDKTLYQQYGSTTSTPIIRSVSHCGGGNDAYNSSRSAATRSRAGNASTSTSDLQTISTYVAQK